MPDKQTEARDLMEVLKWSFEKQASDFELLRDLQQSYDGRINRSVWPADSEIPTHQHFVAVEESLRPAME